MLRCQGVDCNKSATMRVRPKGSENVYSVCDEHHDPTDTIVARRRPKPLTLTNYRDVLKYN